MNKTIHYAIYPRKSSEQEDRQTLSIDSQIAELKKLARNQSLAPEEIVDIRAESHSAKNAFQRPVFEGLASDIENGRVQGVIAWHPNRLSRNAIDAARLIDLMDQGKLLEIVTPSQTFRNTPQDKFLFLLMTSQAKMENDSKGIDVKRGLRKKNEMGFPAGVAKPGYTNDYGIKGQRKIITDSDRFPLVKQFFEAFLTRKYPARKLHQYAKEVLGLTTIQRKKEGGKPLSLSRVYDVLKDPFYAGFFYGKDEQGESIRYEVNPSIERIITEEQYWEIQKMLGKKGAARRKVNIDAFPYSHYSNCGSCGGTIVAEHKYQMICDCKYKFALGDKAACPQCTTPIDKITNGKFLHYIYYHCTRKKNPNCTEKSVREEFVNERMATEVETTLEISPALSDRCIRHLDALGQQDKENELEQRSSWERKKLEKQAEHDELIRMKMKSLIDEETFKRMSTDVQADLAKIDAVLRDMSGSAGRSLEEAKKAFNLIVGLGEVFRSGTFDEKHEALAELGSNLTIMGKEVKVSNKPIYQVIKKGLHGAKQENERFEPRLCEADKDETEVFASVRPTLLPRHPVFRTL